MTANDLLIVYVTCPPNDSERIAETVINEKLAACVNILPVKSIYFWDNKLFHDKETLLIMKTSRGRYNDLERKIKEIHPYDIPEIAAIKAESVQADYLKWVHEQTGER